MSSRVLHPLTPSSPTRRSTRSASHELVSTSSVGSSVSGIPIMLRIMESHGDHGWETQEEQIFIDQSVLLPTTSNPLETICLEKIFSQLIESIREEEKRN
ncbi:hypothetical protein N665_0441s0025 [Sinapis alba]|nr:hypothetical protein N665_0441s0025 [Sinapis alba]